MRRLIDPYRSGRPIRPPASRSLPTGQYGRQWFSPTVCSAPSPPKPSSAVLQPLQPSQAQASKKLVTDIMKPELLRRPARQTVAQRPRRSPVSQRQHRHRFNPLWLLQYLQLPAIMMVAALFALIAQSLALGELAVIVYAVIALVRRISSRTTFAAALLTLVSVVLMLAIQPTNTLAGHFAIYAFLLFLVGTISLGAELSRGRM